jgi:hypothetical protein
MQLHYVSQCSSNKQNDSKNVFIFVALVSLTELQFCLLLFWVRNLVCHVNQEHRLWMFNDIST